MWNKISVRVITQKNDFLQTYQNRIQMQNTNKTVQRMFLHEFNQLCSLFYLNF